MSETEVGNVFAGPHGIRDALLALGVPETEVTQAEADGVLELLALEHAVATDEPTLRLEEVAARSGVEAGQIRAFWRALGFPDPRPGERVFAETDVEMLSAVVEFIREGALESGLALQMSRVIGSAMERVATALVDAIDSQLTAQRSADATASGELDLVEAGEVLPLMPHIMDMVWRRHLGGAARRRIVRAGADEGEIVCVGFADLVGFTVRDPGAARSAAGRGRGSVRDDRLRPHRRALGSRGQDDRRRGHVHDR